MGSRCYFCGESFGRCFEHPGFPEGCPPGCNFGKHDCAGDQFPDAVEHTASAFDEVNHPYRVQCSCGEWCYDFAAHVKREAAS